MDRRKFLIGAGSLAAGSAAAMGTGAFTSVEADRSLEVKVSDDATALLSIDDIDGSGNSPYVDTTGDGVSIDISTVAGGEGLNNNATTKIRDLLKVSNFGTQPVYVWVDGMPDGYSVKFGVQWQPGEGSSFQNPGTGPGENQGALSLNSNLNPNDIDDDQTGAATAPPGKASDTGQEESAPLLNAGDHIAVEMFAYGDLSGLNFDSPVTFNAVSASEIDEREGE
jgi:hypothetical protein